MKTYYKNNLKQAFLIIEGEDSLEQDFQVFMLQGNEIPGLLKTIIKYIDNMTHYHYDVSGMTSLQEVHEKTFSKVPPWSPHGESVLPNILPRTDDRSNLK